MTNETYRLKDEKEDQKQETPSIFTGNSTGEYEYSAPMVYEGGTGEYEFGVMQINKVEEQISNANPDDEDKDDVGSTLLMDKPNIEKAVIPDKTALAEPQEVRPRVEGILETQMIRYSKPMLVTAVMSLFFIGMGFFIFVSTKQESAIAVNEPMPGGAADIPKLSKPAIKNDASGGQPDSPSQKVVYALGYAPFTAAPQGGLKYKSHVISFDGFSDDKLSELETQNCAEISLEGVKISDNNLQKLSKLKNIYMLDLQNAHGFSPKGLFVFKGTTLKRLHLDGTGISDSWIPVLDSLPLEFLSVMGNKLTDESLITLAKSKTLKFLKFEADPSRKVNDTFNAGGWMRLPEGNVRAFNYYRDSTITNKETN